MKNQMKLSGYWNEEKGKLKQQLAKIKNDDLLFMKGKLGEIVGYLQIKLGKKTRSRTKSDNGFLISTLLNLKG